MDVPALHTVATRIEARDRAFEVYWKDGPLLNDAKSVVDNAG